MIGWLKYIWYRLNRPPYCNKHKLFMQERGWYGDTYCPGCLDDRAKAFKHNENIRPR